MSVAIVSGAAGGLGRAFCRRLTDEGYRVVAFDTDEAVRDLEAARCVVADVANKTDVERVIGEAVAMGDVRLLVNNAGVWRRTPVDADFLQALEDWAAIMDVNLKGVLMLSRTVIPHLRETGDACVVNVSADCVLPVRNGFANHPETDLYSASKWALNGFTDAWSKSLAKDGIRVVGLCADWVESPMLDRMTADGLAPSAPPLSPMDVAEVLLEVVRSGRTGENIGIRAGETVGLAERPPPHQRITG